MGGCFGFSYAGNNQAFISKNFFYLNSAGFSSTYDFEFLSGSAFSLDNVFVANIGWDAEGQKVGSGSVGGFRGTHDSKTFIIFDKFFLHWSENKGNHKKQDPNLINYYNNIFLGAFIAYGPNLTFFGVEFYRI